MSDAGKSSRAQSGLVDTAGARCAAVPYDAVSRSSHGQRRAAACRDEDKVYSSNKGAETSRKEELEEGRVPWLYKVVSAAREAAGDPRRRR